MNKETSSSVPNIEAYNRQPLISRLPLSTPFSVEIFPVNACNLKCEFCGRSSDSREYDNIRNSNRLMDIKLLKKSVEDMKEFPEKIKTIHFTGFGEPLMHKNIVNMIDYTVKSGVAEKVDITTNGVLLTNKISNELINANPYLLKISINGLSSEDYKKNCGVQVDFDKLVDNITYFYKNKKHTKMYIKTLDYIVPTEELKKKFYEIFSPICDSISIENLANLAKGINYDKIGQVNEHVSKGGFSIKEYHVCSNSFYYMRINPDGKVVPCFEPSFSEYIGDVSKETLSNIWNGEKLKKFRLKMLDGVLSASEACKTCKIYKYGVYPEDVLDNHINKLKEIYEDSSNNSIT